MHGLEFLNENISILFSFSSCTKGPNSTNTSWHVWLQFWRRSARWRFLLVILHINAATSWALLKSVRANPHGSLQQHDWHRQHMWVCCTAALQRCRVGEKHTWISRVADSGPGCLTQTHLVRTICLECFPMQHASTHCTSSRCSRSSCLTNGSWQSCCLHGSHQDLSGTSGEAQSSSCWFGRIYLLESHRFIFNRYQLAALRRFFAISVPTIFYFKAVM